MSQFLKKTFNDPKIRRSTAVLYKKSTTVPVLGTGNGTKKYRGTLVHGTDHHWLFKHVNFMGVIGSIVKKLLMTMNIRQMQQLCFLFYGQNQKKR